MSCPHAIADLRPRPLLRLCARIRSGSRSSAIPNVGKSVVFGRLTGRYVTVSNYPGTTVAVTRGRAMVGAEVCDIIDTPGVNALEGAISEDERITRDVLASGGADLVVQVADARNLRRALMLTVAARRASASRWSSSLNMIDEALRARHRRRRDGAVGASSAFPSSRRSRSKAAACRNCATRSRRAARPRAGASRRGRSRGVGRTTLTARVPPHRARCRSAAFQEALGARRRAEPLTGLPILALVLYALYLFVGVFGAQTLVELLEDGLFGRVHQPGGDLARRSLHPVPARPRLPRRRVRPDHDGPDLRDRDRAAGRRDLLPDVRLSRGQRLHPAPRDLQRPDLPRRWG